MSQSRHWWFVAVLAVLVASGVARAEAPFANDWRKVATMLDKARLLRWRTVLIAAIAEANRAGATAMIAREGALLAPDAALDRPAIPAGAYQCRTIKLGSKGAYTPAFSVRPATRCTISAQDGTIRLTTAQGSQRPRGRIYPGNEWRQIFLGTLSLGDETRGMDYGRDATRDMAGFLERIGEQRWRLILPEPSFESSIDVIELVPAN